MRYFASKISNHLAKMPNGYLLGMSGSTGQAITLREAMLKNHPLPELKDINALLVSTEGNVFCYNDYPLWETVDCDYAAVGTGMDYAFAAMWCGADAVKAVRCGINFDRNSGGRVMTVKLDDYKERKL